MWVCSKEFGAWQERCVNNPDDYTEEERRQAERALRDCINGSMEREIRIRVDRDKTIYIRKKILENPQNAAVFSRKLNEAFADSRIELEDDETYACVIYIVKKPRYISQVVDASCPDHKMQGEPRVSCIMEPGIMKQVIEAIEDDKIQYRCQKIAR